MCDAVSTNMRRAAGFVKFIRPANCLMMGFAVVVGASLVVAPSMLAASFLGLLLGYVTGFALTGASMAINDYYDRDIDAINAPDHPIPSGAVKPKESVVFAAVLTVVGMVAAAFTSPACILVAAVSWVVSVTYSTVGKRTGLPGNFLVSACVAISFIYGSFVVGQSLKLNIVFFAALALISNMGREVTKGIVDVEGDKTKKIRTVAVVHGEKTASYVAAAFFLSAVCLSLLPAPLGLVSAWFIPFVAIADLGFAASSFMLVRDPSRENARRIKKLVLLWMMMGLVAFIAGNM
jgi:geranylgeranylglycerol-phosphate geranylgeranyltransferase